MPDDSLRMISSMSKNPTSPKFREKWGTQIRLSLSY